MMMNTAPRQQPYRIFLLDRARKRPLQFASLHPHVVSAATDLRESVFHATSHSLWISYARDLTEALVKHVSTAPRTLGRGLFMHALDIQTIPALLSCFRCIAFTTDGGFLPAEELAEVLQAEHRSDLCIGGNVDHATETITFWRGHLKPLIVPFRAFAKSADGLEPDLRKVSVMDGGQTVRLGDYEAAVDAILYEYDPEYRRRMAKKRLLADQSFGASLRRLRLQRGLRRDDFEPEVSAKTIARIEQGQVTRIQKRTLALLAQRLAVTPDEIATF